MGIHLLSGIVVIFGISTAVLFLCQRFRVPSVVGFFLAGILVGPSGFRIVSDVNDIGTLAEIGVILLLFTIGMEFSLAQLVRIKRTAFVAGALQVLLTIAVGMAVANQLGLALPQAAIAGFLIALSSTAIVLKSLQEKAEIESPHGMISMGILLFQDIIVVPMLLVIPLLAGETSYSSYSLLILLGKAAGIIVLVIVASKWIVPRLLFQVARTRSHELFLLGVLVICFGVAWLTSVAGLSLALGAFLAGLIVSETEYGHAALGNILPFRSVFSSFFFVSIGMMLDFRFLFAHPGLILLVTLALMVGKAAIAGMVVRLMGYPSRISIMVGLALCQVGEFSFILSKVGVDHGLISADGNQMLLAAAIISMAATPLIIRVAPRFADTAVRVARLKVPSFESDTEDRPEIAEKNNHLVVVGYGLVGKNVTRAAKAARIPYVIVEMNPDTVRLEREKGEPIVYGDATHEPVLHHVRLETARIALVAINDPTATRRIVEVMRRCNPALHMIVRTRYVQEVKRLLALGADEVVPEEFETSVEIFSRVLSGYSVPVNEIARLAAAVRADGYEMFREIAGASVSFSSFKLQLPEFDLNTVRIMAGSRLIDQTISGCALRTNYGVSVVAIRRESGLITNPAPDAVLRENDILYLLGSQEQLSRAVPLFFATRNG
jgi:monovalent cation:H+ antiporter-2, CPA2 family